MKERTIGFYRKMSRKKLEDEAFRLGSEAAFLLHTLKGLSVRVTEKEKDMKTLGRILSPYIVKEEECEPF